MFGREGEKQIAESWRTNFVTEFRIRGDKRGEALRIKRDMPVVENLGWFRAASFEPFDEPRGFFFQGG